MRRYCREGSNTWLMCVCVATVGHQDRRGGPGVRSPPGGRQHHHLCRREPPIRQHVGRQESAGVGVVSEINPSLTQEVHHSVLSNNLIKYDGKISLLVSK